MGELKDELRIQKITPSEQVELWREHVLIEAGYPPLCARRVAEEHDIDLHQAVDLVLAGCDPYVAEQILS